ncbi:hypothetical protein [Lihuaxuella thermophila]|uniref:LPXTG-motif cell wall anchor domain-containing protein n=1 Tax=Lihuaxuella thermophila TaxID=1173111 RepID=A0A1H8BNI4_9BACL|nr:hypothetical protein [Lihuaxuella thermophila]SEM84461.1 LPXTG-motif cell wall anchor domain-containing protein [Lihuaxuella thermophila]
MKRFAAIFMVLALVFAVVPSFAFAEENTKPATADPAQPADQTAPVQNTDEKADDTQNKTDDGQAPANEDQTKEDNQQSGENKSGNDGAQTGENGQSGNDQDGNQQPQKPEQPEPCPAEPSAENFYDIVVDTQEAGENKVKVIAKLQAKEAEGTWFVGVWPAGSSPEKPPVISDELNKKGTSIAYELDLNKLSAGEYDIYVGFEGTIDGKNCSLGFGDTGIIVEDDDVKPAPQEPKKPSTPEKGKEAVDQLKGGKLPKTATSYPVSMTLGALLLAAGVGMLMFRRLSA